jgi:F-type H+-transporting ATPase subunit c
MEDKKMALDQYSMIAIGYPIGLGIAAIGSGLGLGRAIGGAMEAMGRQPEAAGRIQTGMIIGCAFAEALTIYALIAPFIAGATFMAKAAAGAP